MTSSRNSWTRSLRRCTQPSTWGNIEERAPWQLAASSGGSDSCRLTAPSLASSCPQLDDLTCGTPAEAAAPGPKGRTSTQNGS